MQSSQQHSVSPSSTERQTKQLYLREQIMQVGYQPQQFVLFLNAKLDINSDLDKCTFEQLEEVVTAFKLRKQNQKNQLNSYFRDTQIIQPTICEKSVSITEPVKVRIRGNPQIYEDELKNEVKCVKIADKYQKLKDTILCEVKNPQRKYFGGIFGLGSQSFLCFQVWSHGLNKQLVYRRYSDFIWLRNILLKFYPSYIIPPIPNKKASKRTPRQILKRMRILSMFLNDLVKMPIMLNNKYVQGFLTIKDQQKFQSLKTQGQNKKSYQSILSTETLTGKVQLQLSDKTLRYKAGLMKFVPQIETLYKQITRNSKKMRVMTLQKINLSYQMANQFAQLYDKSTKFNTFIKTQSCEKLSQIYAVLNNMMVEWGNSFKKQIDQIQKNMSTFFKYVRQELMGFKQILQKTNNAQERWLYEKQILDKYKQKIFYLRDPKKWQLPKKDLQNFPKSAIYDKNQAFKIMLPKQSVQVQNLKQNYAYYLAQTYQQGNESFLRCTNKFIENFKQFSIKMKVNNQQVGAMWTQVAYKFSDPYKKPPHIQIMEMQKFQQSENQNGTSGIYDD